MSVNESETYVGIETARLLYDAGFDWGCDCFYGTAHLHNGHFIDADTEFELKAEGRGAEIECVPFAEIYWHYHKNSHKEPQTHSRPTLDRAQMWLRRVKGYVIVVVPAFYANNILAYNAVIFTRDGRKVDVKRDFPAYELAQEVAENECLTLILEEDEHRKR